MLHGHATADHPERATAMHSRIRSLYTTVLAGIALSACTTSDPLELPEPVTLEVPAGAGASLPHIADAGSDAILSWVEPADSGHVLRFAAWNGAAWSEPAVVAAGTDWFVNWADFPSVVSLGGDQLAAHWLQRSGAGTYAYDVLVTRSADGGATWSEPIRPHDDGTPTEHGFVSLFPSDGGLGVVWLDGRRFAESADAPATNEMTVRYRTLDYQSRPLPNEGSRGAPGPVTGSASAAGAEVVLDDRACDCCQTAVAMTDEGPLVAYRDRTPGEVRDISVTRRVGGTWTEPRTLHADGWEIDACPVNGPQADAAGSDVVIGWFTAAADTPRVHVAFSDDAGESFGDPVRVDAGNPLGRVDVLLVDGRALVLWLERTADGAEVRARLVGRDGVAGTPRVIAATLAQRPSGFPRMGRFGDGVLMAWTEPGESSRVLAATLDLSGDRRR